MPVVDPCLAFATTPSVKRYVAGIGVRKFACLVGSAGALPLGAERDSPTPSLARQSASRDRLATVCIAVGAAIGVYSLRLRRSGQRKEVCRITRQALAIVAGVGGSNCPSYVTAADRDDAPRFANQTVRQGGLSLTLRNTLPSVLVLDGLWVQSGGGAYGSALETAGVQATGAADMFLEGPDASAVIWFRSLSWPFAVVTLAVKVDSQQHVHVAGEWGRLPQPDARQMFEKAALLPSPHTVARSYQAGGLRWRRLPDASGSRICADVTVLPTQPTALLPRKTLDSLPVWLRPDPWPEWALPSAMEIASAVFKRHERPVGLHEQLQHMNKGKEDSTQPVADMRLFQLLGVGPLASARAIRVAWRKRAQQLHPDINEGRDSNFDEVREAYRVLSDPILRARYEAVGLAALQDGGSESSAALSVSLTLLLGSWALRDLLGGSLTPPLGLIVSAAEGDATDYSEAFSKQMRALVGATDGPYAEAERVAEMRCAIAVAESLKPLSINRDEVTFEQGARAKFRKSLRAGTGTMAARLLIRMAQTFHAQATQWLHREAPCRSLASPGEKPDVRFHTSKISRAAEAVSIVGQGAASLASLPVAVAISLIAPAAQAATDASAAAANGLIDVTLRTALLEAERRCAATAPSCQRWQAEVVEHVDLLWEDHGDLNTSPLEPLGDEQRLRQEDDNETGIGETISRYLPSIVNGLPVTTLMLRNLPARLAQEALLQFLPEPSVAKYNLLHMPQKTRRTPSSTFAFLNFETHRDAAAFFGQWHGRQIQILMGGTVWSSTVINIEVAKHQSLVANLIEWRAAMRGRNIPATLPAVFRDGHRQDFWQYVRGMQTSTLGRAFEWDAVMYTLQL